MKKTIYTLLIFSLIGDSALAKRNYDKRCTQNVPYQAEWVELKSSKTFQNKLYSTPFALPNGDVIVGSYSPNGDFYVLDKSLKKTIASETLSEGIADGFEWFDKDTVMTITYSGVLIFYNYKTKKITLQDMRLRGSYNTIPLLLSDGTIVFGTESGLAFSRNGSVSSHSLGGYGCRSAPVAMLDDTIVVGCHSGMLHFFSSTGQLINSITLDSAGDFIYSPIVLPNGNIAVGSGAGILYIVSPEGKLIAQSPQYKAMTGIPILINDNTIVVTSQDGYVLFLDASNAREKIKVPVDFVRTSPILMKNKRGEDIIVVAAKTEIFFINTKGQIVNRFKTGSENHTSPTLTPDGNIVVGAENGSVYLLEPRSEKKFRKVISNDCSGGSEAPAAELEEVAEAQAPQASPAGNSNTPAKEERYD